MKFRIKVCAAVCSFASLVSTVAFAGNTGPETGSKTILRYKNKNIANSKKEINQGEVAVAFKSYVNEPIQFSKYENFWEQEAIQNPTVSQKEPVLTLTKLPNGNYSAQNLLLQIYNLYAHAEYRFYADLNLTAKSTEYHGNLDLRLPSSNAYSAVQKKLSLKVIVDSNGNAYSLYENKFVDSMELVTEEVVSEIKLRSVVLNLREDTSTGRTISYRTSSQQIDLF